MKAKTENKNDVLSYLHSNKRYLERLLTYLPNFLNGRELRFEEIDHLFLESFQAYLELRLMPSTAKDRMCCVRTLVKRAIADGTTSHDPFIEYRIRRDDTDKPYFTDAQLKTLLNISPSIHSGVTQTFLFALYTGFHRTKILKLTVGDALVLPLKGKAAKLLHSLVNGRKECDTMLFDALPCIASYHQQTRIWGAMAELPIRPTLEYARNTYIINQLALGLTIKEVANHLGIKEMRHLRAYQTIFENDCKHFKPSKTSE